MERIKFAWSGIWPLTSSGRKGDYKRTARRTSRDVAGAMFQPISGHGKVPLLPVGKTGPFTFSKWNN